MAVFNRAKAFMVRGVLFLHFALVVWRVTVSWSDHYWLLASAILPFLVEGAYTIVKRAGLEWRLFSLCFFFYLCATLPGIWLLEIKKTITYQDQNYTRVEDIVVSGVEIPVRLSPNTWVLVAEEMMLYLMILGRWFLPRGGVGREQLTQLLFGFVGIASDIMELFSLFDEDPGVRHNTLLTYCILGVWSLSVFQFTLTFASAHRPRRARGLRLSTEDPDKQHRRSVLRVELLATVLSMLMQDGPFLVVRLYTMITFQVITYSLVFFTSKNVLVILLLVYKIFLLLGKLCCPKRSDGLEDEDEDLEEDDMYIGPYMNGMVLKEGGHVQHINGRVMHPASRMPQFVTMGDRRQDEGIKLNPLYAGQDKYTRHFLGELQKTYGNRKVADVQRHYGIGNDAVLQGNARNAADLQRYVAANRPVGQTSYAANRTVGDLERNEGNRNVEDLERNDSNQNVGDLERSDGHQTPAGPQRDKGGQVMGELQRAIEGPATPAKKMVRNKKLSRHFKEGELSKQNVAKTDETPDLDISIISSNDLTGDWDWPQGNIHSHNEGNPNASNETSEARKARPSKDEDTWPSWDLD
ncbi:hypothetical protein ACOMHN_049531 [Nucella lapillus]